MAIKLDKRDRMALIKKSGVVMSDHYLRQCLAGTQQMSLHNARELVRAWHKIREAIQPIYGDVPQISLSNLISHKDEAK